MTLLVIELFLCLLFLAKPCSHQIVCLLYAILHLDGILTADGKLRHVHMVQKVQRKAGFTAEHQEKWGVACGEVHNCQYFPPCYTVISFRLRDHPTAIGNDTLRSVVLHLGQYTTNTSVTCIGIQNEASGVVWEGQYWWGDQFETQLLK